MADGTLGGASAGADADGLHINNTGDRIAVASFRSIHQMRIKWPPSP